MAFSAKRAELIAEIAELQRLQMGANLKASLGGWTRQSEEWHEMRDARIAALRRELEALQGADRSELLSEIEELRRQQLEFSRQGGWSREVDEAHERRAERIAALCRQLDPPD